ncbi:MAG TPA: ribose 5-phosphate isomerase B [Chitinophagaceae bacterium]|jgi:ribose 5-phosphate isomerase B|nr:ribose 5-phosphate isomerase B [Chitinophagaceae bacterium]
MAVFNKSLPVAIGSDHAGFAYKTELIAWLEQKGFQVKDFGTYSTDSVDYPDFAHPTAASVEKGEAAFGILLCGSANGVCMTANKHAGIRAGLAFMPDVARVIRQHNDANIICIPARFVALALAQEMIDIFTSTAFEGGRHQTRINKIAC